jgi:hypothetical protein
MAVSRRWCRVTVVDSTGAVTGEHVFEGSGNPDLEAVDRVGRLALSATRLGGFVVVSDLSSEMRELLELAGLPVEMERESELRKEPLGVQDGEEEVHGGDLPG